MNHMIKIKGKGNNDNKVKIPGNKKLKKGTYMHDWGNERERMPGVLYQIGVVGNDEFKVLNNTSTRTYIRTDISTRLFRF